MSRYTHECCIDGKHLEVAYGFDNPLQEYFIQVFDKDDEEGFTPIVWEGSRMTHKSNGEMLELFEKYLVPENHCLALTLDLTF